MEYMVQMGLGFALGQYMANSMNEFMHEAGFNSLCAGSYKNTTPPQIFAQYHAAKNGKAEGPYSYAEIAGKIASKEISANDLVWKSGMASWKKAREFCEFSTHLNSAPPPIPNA